MKKYILLIIFTTIFSFNISFSTPNITAFKNKCYSQRDILLDYDTVFEAMKEMFIKSNINIKNLSKEDGFISGNGLVNMDDKTYLIDISVVLKKKGDITEVSINASYSKLEKERRISSAGIAGIIIPIPTWIKDLNLKETGNIDDPNFYIAFYINFEKVLFDILVRSDEIILGEEVKEKKKKIIIH
ncbi:MAG: hypothetical protein DSY59_05520 [Persephonella sp.]|nr:MAG: hypothetical protein DSY59_05520 [Persephonella sp.]